MPSADDHLAPRHTTLRRLLHTSLYFLAHEVTTLKDELVGRENRPDHLPSVGSHWEMAKYIAETLGILQTAIKDLHGGGGMSVELGTFHNLVHDFQKVEELLGDAVNYLKDAPPDRKAAVARVTAAQKQVAGVMNAARKCLANLEGEGLYRADRLEDGLEAVREMADELISLTDELQRACKEEQIRATKDAALLLRRLQTLPAEMAERLKRFRAS